MAEKLVLVHLFPKLRFCVRDGTPLPERIAVTSAEATEQGWKIAYHLKPRCHISPRSPILESRRNFVVILKTINRHYDHAHNSACNLPAVFGLFCEVFGVSRNGRDS